MNDLQMQHDRRMKTEPVSVQRSMRVHNCTGLTSLPAGKMVPIAAAPLLREDQVKSGRIRLSFESMETAEILMNPINVRVMAYLVPTLALDRFENSMDLLNRSWEGVPHAGNPVVPYVETAAFGAAGGNQIYKYLGLHASDTHQCNTMYWEAYNQIWNMRARNRSKNIPLRGRLQGDLAVAFWNHERFKHIVPDFDQAVIDGQVALNVVNSKMAVKGIGINQSTNPGVALTGQLVNDSSGLVNAAAAADPGRYTNGNQTNHGIVAKIKTIGGQPHPDVFAELAANGITVSLSNIELARKTQAFAKLRETYAGHTDEYIINMLMDGISIPSQALNQPMLLAEKTTVFGMSKRYASDAANLTESVVNGATFIDLSIQVPRISTGGVIMIVAEITPEQLFERQKDPFLHAQNQDSFPHYLRDFLDPEKVEVVPNNFVDVDHATPSGTFGYAPLNYAWNMDAPRIGGRFYRPDVTAGFDEDRQRIWAVETVNPTLSADFYLCTNIHTKPFVVTNQDPFECVTQGKLLIEGLTVFGGALYEATNTYASVMAEAPVARIAKP